MTVPHLRVVEGSPVSDDRPREPFFLIVADYDRGLFSVEGPMTDDAQWQNTVREARNHRHADAAAVVRQRRSEPIGHHFA
jgi:hypothetical protein